ncbi:TetR/AcrR family transcriptional regulator [Leuconostoc mesenteroides]|nr:TetR/AcrR family transcriptional regulator [Leuconostoc mesenteroides]
MPNLSKKRTKNMIVATFGNLLSKCKFETLTVNKISSAALIHRTTFYAHFQDKYQLLDEFLETQIQDTDFNFDNFFQSPFKNLSKIDTTHIRNVIEFQANDLLFNTSLTDFFLKKFRATYKSEPGLDYYLSLGKIHAILMWIEETQPHLSIFDNGEELDKIFHNFS